MANDQLGKSKNLGLGKKIDQNAVFGAYKQSKNNWNAAKCIYGEPLSTK